MIIKTFEEYKEQCKEEHCKGLIFRGYTTQYMGSDGTSIHERKGLKLLKRKSCNACNNCGYDLDDIREHILEGLIDFSPIEDGKLYRVGAQNGSRDWETGVYEDYEYVIVEVKEEDEITEQTPKELPHTSNYIAYSSLKKAYGTTEVISKEKIHKTLLWTSGLNYDHGCTLDDIIKKLVDVEYLIPYEEYYKIAEDKEN